MRQKANVTMMNNLKAYLTQSIDLTNQLHQAFLQEKEFIIEQNSQAMECISKEKISIITQITQLDKIRQAIFKAAGLTESKENMLRLMEGEQKETLLTLWKQLQTNLQACRRQNIVTAMLVNHSLHSTRQLLSMLTGKQADYAYDKQGVIN